jgi:hypothetical protein
VETGARFETPFLPGEAIGNKITSDFSLGISSGTLCAVDCWLKQKQSGDQLISSSCGKLISEWSSTKVEASL